MPEYLYQNTSQKYSPMANAQPAGQGRGPVYLEDNRESTKQLWALQRLMNPLQKQENKTGLPDTLKSGMENLSGMSLDHVKVNFNSPKPAGVQAHALPKSLKRTGNLNILNLCFLFYEQLM